MYLTKSSEKELEIRKMNFRIYFRLLLALIRDMIKDRNDRVVHRTKVHELDESTIWLLRKVLKVLEPLHQKLESGNEVEVMRTRVEEICNCDTHLACLKEVDVDCIGDLLVTDPLRLQEALHKAESGVGVRQPHLFICLRSRASVAGGNISARFPGR